MPLPIESIAPAVHEAAHVLAAHDFMGRAISASVAAGDLEPAAGHYAHHHGTMLRTRKRIERAVLVLLAGPAAESRARGVEPGLALHRGDARRAVDLLRRIEPTRRAAADRLATLLVKADAWVAGQWDDLRLLGEFLMLRRRAKANTIADFLGLVGNVQRLERLEAVERLDLQTGGATLAGLRAITPCPPTTPESLAARQRELDEARAALDRVLDGGAL